MNMATPSSNRKFYANLSGGTTAVDLNTVCAFTSQLNHDENVLVEFHMCSGTIFSCKLEVQEHTELKKYWRYA